MKINIDYELQPACFDLQGSMKGLPTMLLAWANMKSLFFFLHSFVVYKFTVVLTHKSYAKSLLQ